MLETLAESKKILVIGDLILDCYSYLDYAETKEKNKIYRVLEDVYFLGGAGNLVNQLLALNQDLTLISRLGQDLAGQTLWQLLTERFPQASQLKIYRDAQLQTTSKHYLDLGLRLDRDDQGLSLAFDDFLWEMVGSLELSQFDALIFSDYGKGIFDPNSQTIRKIQQLCQDNQVPIFVDTKQVDLSLFTGCHLIKSNRFEFCKQAGLASSYPVPSDLQELANRYQVKNWLVTMDEDGVLAWIDGQYHTYPSLVDNLVNPVGAGDSFLAYYVLAYLSTQETTFTLKLASAAAAVQVEHGTTYTVRLAEVMEKLCKQN